MSLYDIYQFIIQAPLNDPQCIEYHNILCLDSNFCEMILGILLDDLPNISNLPGEKHMKDLILLQHWLQVNYHSLDQENQIKVLEQVIKILFQDHNEYSQGILIGILLDLPASSETSFIAWKSFYASFLDNLPNSLYNESRLKLIYCIIRQIFSPFFHSYFNVEELYKTFSAILEQIIKTPNVNELVLKYILKIWRILFAQMKPDVEIVQSVINYITLFLHDYESYHLHFSLIKTLYKIKDSILNHSFYKEVFQEQQRELAQEMLLYFINNFDEYPDDFDFDKLLNRLFSLLRFLGNYISKEDLFKAYIRALSFRANELIDFDNNPEFFYLLYYTKKYSSSDKLRLNIAKFHLQFYFANSEVYWRSLFNFDQSFLPNETLLLIFSIFWNKQHVNEEIIQMLFNRISFTPNPGLLFKTNYMLMLSVSNINTEELYTLVFQALNEETNECYRLCACDSITSTFINNTDLINFLREYLPICKQSSALFALNRIIPHSYEAIQQIIVNSCGDYATSYTYCAGLQILKSFIKSNEDFPDEFIVFITDYLNQAIQFIIDFNEEDEMLFDLNKAIKAISLNNHVHSLASQILLSLFSKITLSDNLLINFYESILCIEYYAKQDDYQFIEFITINAISSIITCETEGNNIIMYCDIISWAILKNCISQNIRDINPVLQIMQQINSKESIFGLIKILCCCDIIGILQLNEEHLKKLLEFNSIGWFALYNSRDDDISIFNFIMEKYDCEPEDRLNQDDLNNDIPDIFFMPNPIDMSAFFENTRNE